MPYLTQSRGAPIVYPYRYMNGTGYTYDSGELSWPGFNQDTYSFRSEKPVGNEGEGYEDLPGELLAKNVGREYRTRYDNGHPFSTSKLSRDYGKQSYRLRYDDNGGTNYRLYEGPVILDTSFRQLPPLSRFESSTNGLNIIGADLFREARPTAPEAGLAVFLGELKEGLPHLIGSGFLRHASSRAAGGEVLNYQFGIKPLISDLKKMSSSIRHAHSLIRKYRRGSDTVLRRRRHLQEVVQHERVIDGAVWAPSFPRFLGSDITSSMVYNSGITTIVDSASVKSWFSGAFSYHLSEAHSFFGKMDYYAELADYLLGIRYDADDVWNLIPWTWLADWFTDIGTFVTNVTALSNEQLVCRYGYVMQTTSVERVIVTEGRVGCSGLPSHSLQTETYVSKRRQRATPYGFGLNPDTFTTRQWSILGALGLSRSPVSLRVI